MEIKKKNWTNHKWCSGLTIKIFKGSMASSSLHQIRLFSLLLSKIYLNVHQKIIIDAAQPSRPSPEQTTLVSAHLALWHTAAWARWPSINLKFHCLVYNLFYMWVTRVFILSCATLIMALILSSWAQRVPISLFKLILKPIFYTLFIKSPWVPHV